MTSCRHCREWLFEFGYLRSLVSTATGGLCFCRTSACWWRYGQVTGDVVKHSRHNSIFQYTPQRLFRFLLRTAFIRVCADFKKTIWMEVKRTYSWMLRWYIVFLRYGSRPLASQFSFHWKPVKSQRVVILITPVSAFAANSNVFVNHNYSRYK